MNRNIYVEACAAEWLDGGLVDGALINDVALISDAALINDVGGELIDLEMLDDVLDSDI
jgi:hypothetical protein